MSTEQPSIQTDKQAVRSLAILPVLISIFLPIGLLVGAEPLTYFVMIILGFLIGIWDARRKYPSWTERKIAQANWKAKWPTKQYYIGFILMSIAVFLISLIKGPWHGVLIAALMGILVGWALGGFVWDVVLCLRRDKAKSG